LPLPSLGSYLGSFFNHCWYGRGFSSGLARVLLFPFSFLYRLLISLRLWAYARGWLRSTRLPVPVIVVGNLSVGGTGKTPFTLLLVRWLQEAGYTPGILSRGYGANITEAVPVLPDSDPRKVGDEPVLLSRRANCPVWVSPSRSEAGQKLLAFHPEVNVLVTDDGLQHYALARDIEIAVFDATRGVGNGCLLPAGPLREPLSRLGRVHSIVLNGQGMTVASLGIDVPGYSMHLVGESVINLLTPGLTACLNEWQHTEVHALAGIGHPQRFFDHLRDLGLSITEHAFPDHHDYQPEDLPQGVVLMTEKDAVKFARIVQATGRDDCWYLAVNAEVDMALKARVLLRLKQLSGCVLSNNEPTMNQD